MKALNAFFIKHRACSPRTRRYRQARTWKDAYALLWREGREGDRNWILYRLGVRCTCMKTPENRCPLAPSNITKRKWPLARFKRLIQSQAQKGEK